MLNAQNPLHTFPRNFPVDGEVANLLVTSRCNGIWETTRHSRHNALLLAPTLGHLPDQSWKRRPGRRPSQQPMDWPVTQGQQQHAINWPVEKIHHTWSFGSDATVLDDYALTTTTNLLWTCYEETGVMDFGLYTTSW